jgi:hypothetical protein
MDAICRCAICGATATLAIARVTGWMAYPPLEHGDDPQPPAQATGPSLRCGSCVLGLVLVTVRPCVDDDPELRAIRDGYLQALARRAAPATSPGAGAPLRAPGWESLLSAVRRLACELVFLPDPAATGAKPA